MTRFACTSNLACTVCAHTLAFWHLKNPLLLNKLQLQAEVQQAWWLGMQRLLLVAVRTARASSRSASHKQLRSSYHGNACNPPSSLHGRLGAPAISLSMYLRSMLHGCAQ